MPCVFSCSQVFRRFIDRLCLAVDHCHQVYDPRMDSMVLSEEGLASKVVVQEVEVTCLLLPMEMAAAHCQAVQLEVEEVEVAEQAVDRRCAARNLMVERVVEVLADPAVAVAEEGRASRSCVEDCVHRLDFARLVLELAHTLHCWDRQVTSSFDGVAIEVVGSDDLLQALATPHPPGNRVRAYRSPYPHPVPSPAAPVWKSSKKPLSPSPSFSAETARLHPHCAFSFRQLRATLLARQLEVVQCLM